MDHADYTHIECEPFFDFVMITFTWTTILAYLFVRNHNSIKADQSDKLLYKYAHTYVYNFYIYMIIYYSYFICMYSHNLHIKSLESGTS